MSYDRKDSLYSICYSWQFFEGYAFNLGNLLAYEHIRVILSGGMGADRVIVPPER